METQHTGMEWRLYHKLNEGYNWNGMETQTQSGMEWRLNTLWNGMETQHTLEWNGDSDNGHGDKTLPGPGEDRWLLLPLECPFLFLSPLLVS